MRKDAGDVIDTQPTIAPSTGLTGGLMVCGTSSNAGKSTFVAGLCRTLARRGVRVAPFKAQNMALNSMVVAGGGEIGRAQWVQAFAAGVEPTVEMNPVLLKPTGERSSQVVVRGRARGVMTAAEYHAHKPELLADVLACLDHLRSSFDVVICEGAGSPAEINLLDHDIVNLRIAHEAGMQALIVGDIDLGGVFASLYGTVALLPDHYRATVGGFVLNKFRGDKALLADAGAMLEARCGVPTIGVLPHIGAIHIDTEDSVSMMTGWGSVGSSAGDQLDVAVVGLPAISNVTDLDALAIEPAVRLRLVRDGRGLGLPDLIVIPGSKSTVRDLAWLREVGLADEIAAAAGRGTPIVGICGGYQMLGTALHDNVESSAGDASGLGLLPVTTKFEADKITTLRTGHALGAPVTGYEIHHGRVTANAGDVFVTPDDAGPIGGVGADNVLGTTWHGLFESDEFRHAFLLQMAARANKHRAPSEASFAAARLAQIDLVADAIEQHVDMNAVDGLIRNAVPVGAAQ